ncbi:MAG: hypothetical protein ACRETW_09920 [Stenotrophobium sp.]
MEQTLIHKFAAVYAEAVLTFLDSREPQWVLWDGVSNRFDFMSMDLDEPELPALLTIAENWQKQTGDVDEITDPDDEHYDVEALRNAIEHQLANEGAGERILKDFVERLEKAAALEDEDGDDEERIESEDL